MVEQSDVTRKIPKNSAHRTQSNTHSQKYTNIKKRSATTTQLEKFHWKTMSFVLNLPLKRCLPWRFFVWILTILFLFAQVKYIQTIHIKIGPTKPTIVLYFILAFKCSRNICTVRTIIIAGESSNCVCVCWFYCFHRCSLSKYNHHPTDLRLRPSQAHFD